jgi:Kef-type K+ transport system membrane component KefB
MIFIVRHAVRRFQTIYERQGALTENLLALMLLLVLSSALLTEWLGLHLLFGAFLTGAIMPKEHQFVRYIVDRFETVTVTLLLPLFFAFTGLRTNIALVNGPEMWMYTVLIILVATTGKLGGSMIASWLAGMPMREAAGLGTLMNTRGLMELVILNIGLDIKVISPTLFSMMVMMALFTTFMTTPVLEIICPDRILRARVITVPSHAPVPTMALESSDSIAS